MALLPLWKVSGAVVAAIGFLLIFWPVDHSKTLLDELDYFWRETVGIHELPLPSFLELKQPYAPEHSVCADHSPRDWQEYPAECKTVVRSVAQESRRRPNQNKTC